MIDHLSSRTVRRCALGLAAAVVFGASSVAGDGLPPRVGPESQVNTFTRGDQSFPDVARFPDGGFVVIWADYGDSPKGIKGRLFQASGAPASGEILLVGLDILYSESPPHVAALPGGGFAVVWGDFHNILLRRFDREARPLGDPVVVNGAGPGGNAQPDVAADSAGNLAVVWAQFTYPDVPVWLRRFDAAGAPQGDPVKVTQTIIVDRYLPRVAVNDSGSVLVSWAESNLHIRRFDGPSGAWGLEVSIYASYPKASPVVLYPEGDGAVMVGNGELYVQRLDAAGRPLGALRSIKADEETYTYGDPDVAVDASGRAFAVWSQYEASSHLRIYGRLLDRAWQPLGDARPISSVAKLPDQFPAVAAGGGGFATVWANGELPPPIEPITPPRPQDGRDGDSFGVFAQAFGAPECLADSEVLCLGEGQRFRVKVSWKIPGGETGVGRSHPLTADTGALWFFNPSNLELILKVLDGRTVNGHFWVFYGGLSDVEYTITVTDTATGREKTYHNPPGRLASQADTSAFADAGAAAAASLAAAAAADTGCPTSGDGTTLCLQSGRFLVDVTFTDPRNGASGPGQAVDLTADTGAFWFFGPSNLELMIKVLDGRPVNGRFWVFFGALSDVAYTIRVTDTETGEQRTYVNPRGQLASRADTSAFR